MSLIELAVGFVVNHPAVTSAIIGRRTLEQLDSDLPAAEVMVNAAILDHKDEIVRPAVNLNPADTATASTSSSLCFGGDKRQLYVADSGHHSTVAEAKRLAIEAKRDSPSSI